MIDAIGWILIGVAVAPWIKWVVGRAADRWHRYRRAQRRFEAICAEFERSFPPSEAP